MTAVGDESASVAAIKPTRGLLYRLSALGKIGVAILLALTPFTAFLVLGWLVRVMRREAVIAALRGRRLVSRAQALELTHTEPELSRFTALPGWWSGLWRTVLDGARAIVVTVALVLPFGLILLLSWWAGWENSFNKGYEQAWVGPLLGLVGAGLGMVILSHLPMVFAHFAAEGRIRAAFDIAVIRRLIREVRWRYVLLTLATVILSASLFLAQILPTFMEKINPALIDADAKTVSRIAFQWHLGATTYLVAVLFFLRRWTARLYGGALLSLPDPQAAYIARLTQGLTGDERGERKRTFIGGIVAGLLTATAWLGFLVMLYIAQFANHAWWNWVNHPMIALPWVFQPV